MNYEALRVKMVDNQIRPTDVTSHSVLSAFLSVPREEFVPADKKALAYIDTDIAVGGGRYLMEPSPLAKLVQMATIGKDDLVLEVGCNSGYASAIFSQIASSVVALESDETLAGAATQTLSRLGYDNVAVVTGALEAGYKAEAPFDVIFLHGSVAVIPQALFDQLRDGGRLVAVIGEGNASRATLYIKERGVVTGRPVFNTSVKPLPGFAPAPEFVF
ncbi:protein-L-isoaspartate O-methyltransferase [Rhizobium sp. RU20A]|uniref:protein-L-isoaspartate O-methyltransferase family protein n=1 Tax=Rhizobium sp. RU20A TaxID=1907412 RepID=UPI00122C32C8|nr:protein-L-isoaspartate O-methyltransferase [Rhizobium sp. RU20A]